MPSLLAARKSRDLLHQADEPKMKAVRRRGKRVGHAALIVVMLFASLIVFGLIISIIGYLRVPAVNVSSLRDSSVQVYEVSQLYPVTMARVVTPHTVDDISRAVKASAGPVSIGGARFSMGGQTATPEGLQLDMRSYRGVVAFDPARRTITVRSGTRWREVQQAIDSAGLAVKIMQTYNTFTVGGALSVNAHGRYIGEGPIIRSVRQITIVLPDGRVETASPTVNPELFYGAIGGYGALGVIADVTLDLAVNSRLRREDESMPVARYPIFFRGHVGNDTTVIFHNADIYPPDYETIHAVSYRSTRSPVTIPDRMLPADQSSWTHRLAYSVITEAPGGRWIRKHVIDPWTFRGNPVTWRNYEASYDVSELEPASRDRETYVLQEYFIPVDSFAVFMPKIRRILRAHDVNAVNISVRHALPDSGSFLSWAPTEVFAFVLYYKQGTDPTARREVARWTRELIDAALTSGGRYYLPYQPVATRAQFARAYPNAKRLFAVKRRVDPGNKFTNTLWDLYLTDGNPRRVTAQKMPAALPAEVRIALDTVRNYAREESDEFITHPEWDLVYSSEAYAQWLHDARPPSAFPFIGSVGAFWRAYHGAWQAGRERYAFSPARHVMLWVIGVSTAIEYGFRAIYEGTVGRAFEATMPAGGTAEDQYSAYVAAEYAALISERGWYDFDFVGALANLWYTVPESGAGAPRKWERRFALSAEYLIKALYAAVIGFGTKSTYTPAQMVRYAVVAGWPQSGIDSARLSLPDSGFTPVARLDRGYTLLAVRRYLPFRDALLDLSADASDVRVAELSGSEVVTMSGTAPAEWEAPLRATPVIAYRVPTDPERRRILLRVNARDLLDVLNAIRTEGVFEVEHIYDY
ncbi:MAG TPA: FAD-binding oxidoreductase [Gemmatimonadaceae bacterium]